MSPKAPKKAGINSLLKPYRGLIFLLILFALLGNGINLLLPKLIAFGIDSYSKGNFNMIRIIKLFSIATILIFIFSYIQSIIQTYASEKVARDLRTNLTHIISAQSFAFIQKITPSKLLTNLTADVDSIKMYVSQAIVSIVSSIFIIIGSSILLISINWKLGLAVLIIIPVIGITFFLVLKKVRALFMASRGVIDILNRVITESILGAALIRIINSQMLEYDKFVMASNKAKDLGLTIMRQFAVLIPIITFTANMANFIILVLGGHFVITGNMSLGDFAAFTTYLTLLIFPILVIGFMSNIIAQASASYQRILAVTEMPPVPETGILTNMLTGKINVDQLVLSYGQKIVLKSISFQITPGNKVAIIGPTAAGKSQLFQVMTGLINSTSGKVTYDDHLISEFKSESFYSNVGLVFQDSVIFNMSIRENIAFNNSVSDDSLAKAIKTASLSEFIKNQPEGLNTIISERGSNLSGGQKQRIMLARALAIEPKILLLDDFTARVDTQTELKILKEIENNYPGITLVSITQKIASVEKYDQIILIMEGEILATGKHDQLMSSSTEYVQIFNSQQSTGNYEL